MIHSFLLCGEILPATVPIQFIGTVGEALVGPTTKEKLLVTRSWFVRYVFGKVFYISTQRLARGDNNRNDADDIIFQIILR